MEKVWKERKGFVIVGVGVIGVGVVDVSLGVDDVVNVGMICV